MTHPHHERLGGRMNNLQPYNPQPVQLPAPRRRPGVQMLIMVLAALYWLSPIDAIPFVPIDDLVVMILAISYAFPGGNTQ